MSSDSTRKPRSRKAAKADRPKKPYPDFPLTPHPSGAWQKKIRGKIHYFGRWAKVVNGKLVRIEGDGWKEALELYKADADDLHAGRTPRLKCAGLTVADLCNRFLTAKQRKLDAGEMTARMFAEYKQTTDRLVSTLGKTRLVDDVAADDFEALRAELAKQFGPVRLGNEIQRVRTVFKYGIENGLIQKAILYGSEFKKPGKRVMRRHRAQLVAKNGKRTFEPDALRTLIATAGVPLKAMILLGINAGFGNADCGQLPLSALDLEGGWVEFPRPKTGIERRCPLWTETVEALKAVLAARPEPKKESDAGLVFVTKYGRPWATGGTSDAVTLETGKLLRKLELHRPGLGFYALRHTFRTVADATKDTNAIRLVMGHTDDSIDDNYTHGIDDDRLRAVAEYVRAWLFNSSADPTGAKKLGAETCDPTDPCDPEETGAGSEGAQGSQVCENELSAKVRPALRLYVG